MKHRLLVPSRVGSTITVGGVSWDEHEQARPMFGPLDECGVDCPRDPAKLRRSCTVNRPGGKPCGYCHACGAKLPTRAATSCPTCGCSDYDE